ncbi:hypothetical protein, partial [Sphingomonas sp.]|uniref:hypothetical protein n=1 Tax=Sphingomonas sp. TaxID=28214 RepID=UPI0025CBB5CF
CSFKIAMICSSLNLLRFILVRLLCVGLYSKSVTFQGRTSTVSPEAPVVDPAAQSALGFAQ